jgi:Zn-dependent protease with chaperone function
MSEPFPNISIQGDSVNAKECVEKGTGGTLFYAFFIAIIGTLVGILVSYGVLLIVLIFYPLFASLIRKKAMAMIHGSGVHVSENQFPAIHDCVNTFKQRLGVNQEVSVYIVEDNVANAMAVRYGKKNVILLTDDIIRGCLASNNPKALAFVIAHDLAHVALNHNAVLRSWMAKYLKKLGRLDEYSADTVATALVQDEGIAFTGLLLLTVGWALLPYVNRESIIAQAQEVGRNKYSRKAEKSLTHPLLLNRLNRVLQRQKA